MTRTSYTEQSSVDEARENIGRISVIAIAVSRYDNLNSLLGTTKDLSLVENLFVRNKRLSILDSDRFIKKLEPTADEVRCELLEYTAKRSANGDVLIFYFSGHGCVIGTNSFGFCLKDTALSKDGSFLSLSILGLREVIQTLMTAHVLPVFIIDACFSGAAMNTPASNVISVIHEDLHMQSPGAYGLLCSSGTETTSIDTKDGGVFTKTMYSIISRGLFLRNQRHWPFITLNSIALPLQETLAQEGYPLSKCYSGPALPEIPIAQNVRHKPQTEYFSPQMRKIVDFLWNDGSPRNATINELGLAFGKGAYANHSKLSYAPWRLLEDGPSNTRRLTRRGKKFAQGETRIPKRIVKDPKSWQWVAKHETERLFISDVTVKRKGKRED